MTGKEFLYSLKQYNSDILKKAEKLEQLKAKAISITASTDKESVQSNGDQDKLGSIMAKIVDLENELDGRTFDLLEDRKRAKQIIFTINDENCQNMLYDFFICYMPLYEIAEETGMSYENARRIKRKAIKEFEHIYNNK